MQRNREGQTLICLPPLPLSLEQDFWPTNWQNYVHFYFHGVWHNKTVLRRTSFDSKAKHGKASKHQHKRTVPNTEVKWTATCLKLGDALTPPCDLMWPFRAGKLLNSFKHIEHISLFFASALSGSVSLFWPLFLFSFFKAWNRRKNISLACSLCCRGRFLIKKVNKILELDDYEVTSKHVATAVEYMANNLDQLLPRWGQRKFWVGHAHQYRRVWELMRSTMTDLHFPTHYSN